MLEASVSSTPSIWAVVYSWFTPTVFFLLLQLMIGTIFITSTFANSKRHDQPQSHADHHPQQLPRSPSVLQRLKSINFYSYRSQESPHHTSEFHPAHEAPHPPLTRSPSMLQRLKSINLYDYFPTDPISSRFSSHDATHSYATRESDPHFDLPKYAHEPERHHLDGAPVVESDGEGGEEDGVGEIQHPEPDRSLDEIYSELQGVHVSRTKSDTKPASGDVPEKLPRKMKKSATTKSAFGHFREEDIVENRRPATMREAKASESEADDEVDAKADDFINKFKQQLKLQRLDSIMRYEEVIQRGSGN
ncbi:pathogen-associated molecular patterns-induced protein A70-like [Prosopis cineraria]|uniref:pathogen-associated molecular patterns-induced protein A70-like n=1 Tax=Prosopis cineraria TaxID=364024 RepID=UPI00240F61DC|nr:pathogen-associated molecular patterns-induced protein A70-like [Prosopis cineraria]